MRETEDLVRRYQEMSEGSGGSTSTRNRPPQALETERTLTEALSTTVKVSIGKSGKGKITLEFTDLEDLERLSSRLSTR